MRIPRVRHSEERSDEETFLRNTPNWHYVAGMEIA